jgi:hypothetical protein
MPPTRAEEVRQEQDEAAFLNHLTSAHFLRRLPPATTTLYLASAHLPLETMVAWIKDLPTRPHLRMLTPAPSYWFRLLDTMDEVIDTSAIYLAAKMALQSGEGSEEEVGAARAEWKRADKSDALCEELEREYKRRGLERILRPTLTLRRGKLMQ